MMSNEDLRIFYKTDGNGIRVALLDTGVNISHPYFSDKKIDRKDLCNPGGDGNDSDGHGTHCAGAIFQLAPGCTLLSGKIMDRNGMFTNDALLDGLFWAERVKADIVCVCSGEKHSDEDVRKKITQLSSGAIPIIAAIGNAGDSGPRAGFYPARYNDVWAVGSLTDRDELSAFTSLNTEKGIVCVRGENIEAPYKGNDLIALHGTSGAAARFAGIITLMASSEQFKNASQKNSIFESMHRALEPRESSRGRYFIFNPTG